MEDNDPLLHLKKRARRRLVGAVALAGLAAVVLPIVMDHEPKPAAPDVEIRIPGQDEKPFTPGFAAAPQTAASASAPSSSAPPGLSRTEAPTKPPLAAAGERTQKTPEPLVEKAVAKPDEKAPASVAVQKPVEKAPAPVAAKPPEKPPVAAVAQKSPEKPKVPATAKSGDKPAEKTASPDSNRAAAILAGKSPEPVNAGAQHVILIGAFANQANVKNLQTKLGQLGIKVYTEPLDSPQGKKMRVRAGPFPNREAGEKALEKMKRIGVSGVLTAKQ